jgi:P pilus assembly chaperone PapD
VEKKITNGQTELVATITNPGNAPALTIRLGIQNTNGERLLPVFYSDNYFSLLPGEKKQIRLSYDAGLDGKEVSLFTEGWNVDRKYNKIK